MSRQTLFAYLPDESRAEQVLSVAASLARRDQSHLIASYVIPPLAVHPRAGDLPKAVYESHAQIYRERAEGLERRFDEITQGDRFVGEWRTIDAGVSSISSALMPHVRCADLVIVPGYSDNGAHEGTRNVIDNIAMECGRPVLMLPSHMPGKTVGQHVTVAWDGSREATRAVFDAMDLLHHASSVRLVSVGTLTRSGSNTDLPGAELAATLGRRGIRCETDHIVPGDLSIGDALLSRIAEMGSDLLVMGLYGHSKLREFVFGGVTRHVLNHMTVPVLVSH